MLLTANPKRAWELGKKIHSLDASMATRSVSFIREMTEGLGKNIQAGARSATGRALRAIGDTSMLPLQWGQNAVDLPIWIASFIKNGGDLNTLLYSDADTIKKLYSKQIAIATQDVIATQGGGRTSDMSAHQRGSAAWKFWTTFMGYGVRTYNLEVEALGRIKRAPKSAKPYLLWARDTMYLSVIPAMWAYAASVFFGAVEPPEDAKDTLAHVGLESIGMLLNGVVIARELGGALYGIFDYDGPVAAAPIAEAYKAIGQVAQGEWDEALLSSLISVAGGLLGLPSDQIKTTIRGTMAAMEGRANPILAPIFGPPRE